MPTPPIDVPVYLQVEPRDRAWDHDTHRYDGPPRAAAVIAQTRNRPNRPRPGVVVVKITLRIPPAAFDPLRPEVVVEVPAEHVQAVPVVVIAEDPREGDA